MRHTRGRIKTEKESNHMETKSKTVDQLIPKDFEKYPIWKFSVDLESNEDETKVVPVKKYPVDSLDGKIIGCSVQLKNGHAEFAILGNIHVTNWKATDLFLTVSIYKDPEWLHLSRYFDSDYSKNGPDKLAKHMKMKLEDIFPMSCDITKYAKGDVRSLRNNIFKEPKERLSRDQIMALLVP